MSREIDLTKPLSDEDKQYLMIRGREQEVRENERMSSNDSEAQRVPHTGDVGTDPETARPAGIRNTTQEVPNDAKSAAARAGMRGIVQDDDETETGQAAGAADDSEGLEPPYDQHTKKELIAEIERRNALPENEEYEDISTSGDKADLVARLEEDDEASE